MKKFVSIFTACILLVSCLMVQAFAVAPSKDTDDMTDIDGNVIFIPEEAEEWYDALNTQLTDLSKEGISFASTLDAEVVENIAKQLPEGVDVNDLVITEMIPLEANDYEEDMGDITALITFPTQFTEEMNPVAVVGFCDEVVEGAPNMVWYALNTSVTEDGSLEVVFPAQLIPRLNAQQAALVILSNPV